MLYLSLSVIIIEKCKLYYNLARSYRISMDKLFHLLTISLLLQSCISESNRQRADTLQVIERDTELINYQAPFYTHRLPTDYHPRISKLYDSSLIESYYPFTIIKDSTYMIAAEIEKDERLDSYRIIFERHGFFGNGYNWGNYITHMLSIEDSGILSHVELDPEAGGFYAFADSEKNQRKFAVLASRFFRDTTIFESHLSTIDSSIIDN